MIHPLPKPIPANFSYDSVRVENIRYDGQQYTADVFGVSSGQSMPFIFATGSGLHRITECVITDSEIDAYIAQHPEITVRLDAGMRVAMARLYALGVA